MKYAEVFWAPFYEQANMTKLGISDVEFANDILFTKPKPFFPMLLNARQGMPYMKCPAVAKAHQNDFVVCAPYDLVFTFDEATKTISTDRYGQTFFNTMVSASWAALPQGMPPLIQTVPRYIMYSFANVEIETTDLAIIHSEFSRNTKVVQGTYNISKWYRPWDTAFEVVDINKPVVMEAGEPLCLLRFRTPNNVPVKFTRVDVTPELNSRVSACLHVKYKQSGLKLEQLYDLATDFIEAFKRRNK